MMLNEKSKKNLTVLRNMAMAVLMCNALAPILADSILTTLAGRIETIYGQALPLVLAFAALALLVCAFFYFTSKDPRKSDEAFQWGKRILIGAVVAAIAPKLLVEVIKLFGDGMTGSSFEELQSLVE